MMKNGEERKYYKSETKPNTSKRMEDILKMLTVFDLQTVSRSSSNRYICDKTDEKINRKETTAEHIVGGLKLIDYFLLNEPEFESINQLEAYNMFLYHDDVEIITGDYGISDRGAQETKGEYEIRLVAVLANDYPSGLKDELIRNDRNFRENKIQVAKFCHAIDKLQALIHEIRYPEDWGHKTGFTEENVIKWFGKTFEYSPTFMEYFNEILLYLRINGYFE